MNKELTIFIAGAEKFSNWPKLSQWICTVLSKPLKLDKTDTEYTTFWRKDTELEKENIIWMKWSRKTNIFSKWLAKYKLRRLIKKYKNVQLNLVGISLGGGIILNALKEKEYENIKKIVLVASINEDKYLKNNKIPIYNIYSVKDNFAKFAINIYSPIYGGKELLGGNIYNIKIPLMEHHNICENNTIPFGKFKGMKISNLVNNILNKK